MKKKHMVCLIAFILLALIIPSNVQAKQKVNNVYQNKINYNINIENKVLLLDTTKEDMNEWLEGYNQTQSCEGGLLGNVNDPNSVAWLLQKVLNYLKIIGPFLVVVMSGIDFAKVIVTSDDDGMKKAQKKLITRLILAASLFFLPDLVTVLLNIMGITSNATCGLS